MRAALSRRGPSWASSLHRIFYYYDEEREGWLALEGPGRLQGVISLLIFLADTIMRLRVCQEDAAPASSWRPAFRAGGAAGGLHLHSDNEDEYDRLTVPSPSGRLGLKGPGHCDEDDDQGWTTGKVKSGPGPWSSVFLFFSFSFNFILQRLKRWLCL